LLSLAWAIQFESMTGTTTGRCPMDKEVSVPAENIAKQGDFHEDREIGLDAVDIARIEKVYKYV
jgi:hypothetical protein